MQLHYKEIERKKYHMVDSDISLNNSVTIDFQVTSKCHLDCKYCFDILKGTPDRSTYDLLDSIDKLYSAGVRSFCVTGGEPAKRDDINQILQYIYQKGIYLYLSTQGNYIGRLEDETIGLLNCIGLPLDSISEEINFKLGRPRNQKDIFLRAYSKVRKLNPNCLIKIGTVVNKLNINNLMELGSYIEENANNCTWRVYEFNPIGNGAVNKSLLSITTTEFDLSVAELKKKFPKLEIVPMHVVDAENGYFFVGPQMDLLYFAEKEFVKIGSIPEMSSEEIRFAISSIHSEVGDKVNRNRKWLD